MLYSLLIERGKGMFITEDDYRVVIGESALKITTQASEESRIDAEQRASEEISGYLRPKYDCRKIFEAQGEERSGQIIMYTCDIALYHLASSLPQKMGMEIRKERYDRAIKWLEGVQSGKIVPDLPLMTDEDGEALNGSFVYGCQNKLRHNW